MVRIHDDRYRIDSRVGCGNQRTSVAGPTAERVAQSRGRCQKYRTLRRKCADAGVGSDGSRSWIGVGAGGCRGQRVAGRNRRSGRGKVCHGFHYAIGVGGPADRCCAGSCHHLGAATTRAAGRFAGPGHGLAGVDGQWIQFAIFDRIDQPCIVGQGGDAGAQLAWIATAGDAIDGHGFRRSLIHAKQRDRSCGDASYRSAEIHFDGIRPGSCGQFRIRQVEDLRLRHARCAAIFQRVRDRRRVHTVEVDPRHNSIRVRAGNRVFRSNFNHHRSRGASAESVSPGEDRG